MKRKEIKSSKSDDGKMPSLHRSQTQDLYDKAQLKRIGNQAIEYTDLSVMAEFDNHEHLMRLAGSNQPISE